jgi:hypothetical protein
MPYTDLQRFRIELGLCFQCGAMREGEGINKWYCAVCNAKHCKNRRNYLRRKQETPVFLQR